MTHHRYIRYHELTDYLDQGWLPSSDLDGTCHGQWSVLCHWVCGCPVPGNRMERMN